MSLRPSLLPPGHTETIAAAAVLVVAPHYDDEVLGCGGLLAALARQGAAVRVLFLSDGSGGVEEIENRAGYADRRRAESSPALAALGIAGAEHLGLPDGSLAHHLPVLESALRRSLLSLRPELLLVPSPLEATSDHRAAFTACHRVLSPLRPDDALYGALGAMRVLLYEVNHPAYPDLLVDVSGELPAIERAMLSYASQQERHDYLAAGLGLRRYRALSLPRAVEAAEGYRRLDLTDFTTRSLSRLVSDLGGAPELLEVREGPAVSVVVRTCDRPALLAEALASLAGSTYQRVEVVLVNDGGAAPAVPDGFPFAVRRVDLPERRGRSGAANAGIAAASGDFVGFLDDDDLVEREHLATLAGLVGGARVRIAYSDAAVGVYEPGPAGWEQVERRLPYSRDFDPDLLLLDNYIPFNTLLIDRRLLAEAGPVDEGLPFFEDWELLIRLSRLAPFHHCRQVTCEYRHFRGGGHVFGERPRERPDFLAVKQRVLERHRAALTSEVLARAVDRLRREAVESVEEARSAQAAAAAEHAARRQTEAARFQAEVARAAAEDLAHRRNGELVALREHLDVVLAHTREVEAAAARHESELGRLYGVEAELRQGLAGHEAHLARCYAEIARLEGLIGAMRGTRAWRLHEWVERRRGRGGGG
jgi:LmbE family N-acetylglucosaminyl deacetylase/flagellar biosynthesis regulator FlaF